MHDMTLHNDESKYCQFLLDEMEALEKEFKRLLRNPEIPGRSYFMEVVTLKMVINRCKIHDFTDEIMDANFINRKNDLYVS